MCGICGVVSQDKPVDIETVKCMTRLLHHRGPDDEGYHCEAHVGLGHRRLSIIDVSKGHQPIYNEKKNLSIVFNGEIYNYRELKKGLIKNGHEFSTNSDTETILHLYEEMGASCLNVIDGMFAFAIWNSETKELFIARDRVGKKPLYYVSDPRYFLFASEMKSILAFPDVSREIDYQSIYTYLSYGYIPAPDTIIKKIKKLESGCYLIVKNGRLEKKSYWELNYQANAIVKEPEAIEKVKSLIDSAVKSRLESEVPLGCLLSGGIDSSANVAFMRKNITGDIRTFTIGFEEDEYDETSNARLIAKKFNTIHEELVVKPDAVSILPEIVWNLDEPMFDSSAVATYYVAQMASKHVSVVLTGDGGDESFFGYTRYLLRHEDDFMSRWKRIPYAIRSSLFGPISKGLFKACPSSSFTQRLLLGNQSSLLSGVELYAHNMKLFHDDIISTLLTGRSFPGVTASTDLFLKKMNEDSNLAYENQMIRADNSIYLHSDLLVKIDRMTMAHSLEARSPFLDHHLMEYVASLPLDVKFRGHELKYLLKKVLRGVLPDEILDGQKRGFTVPIKKWFREEMLSAFAKDVLLSSKSLERGLFNPRYIEQLLRDHASGNRDYHMAIWSLINLELWFKTFIDRSDVTSGPIS